MLKSDNIFFEEPGLYSADDIQLLWKVLNYAVRMLVLGAGWIGMRETSFRGPRLPSPPHAILLRMKDCSLKGGPVRLKPQASFRHQAFSSIIQGQLL